MELARWNTMTIGDPNVNPGQLCRRIPVATGCMAVEHHISIVLVGSDDDPLEIGAPCLERARISGWPPDRGLDTHVTTVVGPLKKNLIQSEFGSGFSNYNMAFSKEQVSRVWVSVNAQVH